MKLNEVWYGLSKLLHVRGLYTNKSWCFPRGVRYKSILFHVQVANQLSSNMQNPTTIVDASDNVNLYTTDPTTLTLPLHVPMSIQTYYETICKNEPLARRNIIIERLQLASGPPASTVKYKFVIAKVKHLGGHDISDRLDYLIFETSQYSPIGSSSGANHIVSQCRQACFSDGGDRYQTNYLQHLYFNSSPDTDVRNLCSLDELFRLVTIVSPNSHLYSTDIDVPLWFACNHYGDRAGDFSTDNPRTEAWMV